MKHIVFEFVLCRHNINNFYMWTNLRMYLTYFMWWQTWLNILYVHMSENLCQLIMQTYCQQFVCVQIWECIKDILCDGWPDWTYFMWTISMKESWIYLTFNCFWRRLINMIFYWDLSLEQYSYIHIWKERKMDKICYVRNLANAVH